MESSQRSRSIPRVRLAARMEPTSRCESLRLAIVLIVGLLLAGGPASLTTSMQWDGITDLFDPLAEGYQSALEESTRPPSHAVKATTTWTGVVTLNSDYTVAFADELRILSGTIVEMGPSVRIIVDGRLTILGTGTDPVTLRSIISTQRHEGIQFNSTSAGRGSSIQHLNISQAWFGITIFDSDPSISNISIGDADYVAIDIFDGSPTLRDIRIQDGGEGVHIGSSHWRYGIGLSVGAQASPLVTNLSVDGVMTRAVNYWGGAGGMLSDLRISNVSGATRTIPAGIWIEDSIPLIVNANITRSDNGVYVSHVTENGTTRPTFRDLVVEDSMYNGVFVERYNKSQFSNLPLNGVFRNITIRGTGGPNAQAPGVCFTAFGVNTSSVDVDGALLEDNDCNGFKAYMIDSTTIVNDVTVINSGDDDVTAPTNDRAGMFLRSVNWGPTFDGLNVTGSSGDGILLWKSSLRGSDWESSDNQGIGLAVRESHPEVDGILVESNGKQGVWVHDSSNVLLTNATSRNNGANAGTGQGFGFRFQGSSDFMSDGKNVSCVSCRSESDVSGGLWIDDSIDLQIHGFTFLGAPGVGPAIQGGNGGLTQNGHVILTDLELHQNATALPVLYFDEVDAHISNLTTNGSHAGVQWDAIGNVESRIDGATLEGVDCLTLIDHQQFIATSVDLSGCNGSIEMKSGTYNLTGVTGAANLTLDQAGLSTSVVNWISSGTPPAHALGLNDRFDLLWMVDLWAVNQRGNGLPYSLANLSFDQFQTDVSLTLPYDGNALLGPFIGKRWTLSGTSAETLMWAGCDYDGVHNDTEAITLDGDLTVICWLDLQNQAPFINWTTPLDGEVFPSGGTVVFNATDSWDLDEDMMIANWSSDIDGDLRAACYGGQGWPSGNGSGLSYGYLVTNGNDSTEQQGGGWFCPLSDGVHTITLDICDSSAPSLCSNETRQIELRNLPPSIDINLDPAPDALGYVHLGRTETMHVNASGTTDPEGDPLLTSVFSSLGASWTEQPPACTPPNCPLEWNLSFASLDEDITSFDLNITFSDGVNPVIDLVWAIELHNALPSPSITLTRTGNLSRDTITLDASATMDPEGDSIRARWSSNMIGALPDPSTPLVWEGQLPPGRHVVTLEVSDDRPEHAFNWIASSVVIDVENTPPNAVISSPTGGLATDSSELVEFTAGAGSGDWDVGCVENSSITLWCNPTPLGEDDLVSAVWTSNLMTAPIGSGWSIGARLSAGDHAITLTVDDGQGSPASATVNVSVATSAPLLVLDSPIAGVEVHSDGPVLFDFRRSWDPDGDAFEVNVTSDHIGVDGPIVANGTTEFWYNDWLPAGSHLLTFRLTDSTGAMREVTQALTILPTGPQSVIQGAVEGQYVGPGVNLSLVGSESTDYDDDIVLYEWSIGEPGIATVAASTVNWTITLQPGSQRINLRVVDSRGDESITSINVTIGMSNPTLRSLQVHPNSLVSGVAELLTVTVILEDADGTTQNVRGRVSHSGEIEHIDLFDDGSNGDEEAGDGVWTGRIRYTANGAGWARVEAWAEDGEMVSPTVKVDLEVKGGEDAFSFASGLVGGGFGIFLVLAGLLLLAGAGLMIQRRVSLKRDLALIESWSGVGFEGIEGASSDDPSSAGLRATDQMDWDDPLAGDDEGPPRMDDL